VTPNFVIGTGRCGSTLITRILHDHPDVLSLSELFAALGADAFAKDQLTGQELWALLCTPRERTTVLLRSGPAVDEIAPVERAGQGVPPVMLVTLPQLTADPGALLAEIGAFLRPRPQVPAAEQYEALFSWLCDRLGRKMWVERSGGSLRFVRQLRAWWPAARYAFLARDGRDTAISMSRHGVFRMAVAEQELRSRLAGSGVAEEELLRAAARAAQDGQIPLERFGELWSYQIVSAIGELRRIPDANIRWLSYEALLADPRRVLTDLLDFFGLAQATPAAWIREQARRVRPPASSWRTLPEPELALLQRSCRIGQRLLR